MTVIEGDAGYYVKSRPSKYKDPDDVFGMIGGNGGRVLAKLPKDYPLTEYQKAVKDAAEECDIKAGMKREDLKKKMRDCIPENYEEP